MASVCFFFGTNSDLSTNFQFGKCSELLDAFQEMDCCLREFLELAKNVIDGLIIHAC